MSMRRPKKKRLPAGGRTIATYTLGASDREQAYALMAVLGLSPHEVMALDGHPMTILVADTGECLVRYDGAARCTVGDIEFILDRLTATGPANDATAADGNSPARPGNATPRPWRPRSSRTHDA